MSEITTDPTDTPADPSAEWDAQIAEAMEAAFAAPPADDEPAPEVEPEPVAAEEPPAPEPEEPPAGLAGVINEVGVDETTAEQILRWAAGLTPEQVEAVNASLTQPPPAASGHGPAAPQAPADGAAGSSLPDMPDITLLAEAVPGFKEYLSGVDATMRAQQIELERVRSQQTTLVESEAQRTQRQTNEQIDAGIASFREQYADIDDQSFERVLQRATDLQVLPGLVSQHSGQVDKAMADALTTAMWSDPDMRDRLVQATLNDITSQQEATRERRQKAASLSGGSGSVPGSRTTAAPVNLTREQHRAQMIESVAAEIQGRAS